MVTRRCVAHYDVSKQESKTTAGLAGEIGRLGQTCFKVLGKTRKGFAVYPDFSDLYVRRHEGSLTSRTSNMAWRNEKSADLADIISSQSALSVSEAFTNDAIQDCYASPAEPDSDKDGGTSVPPKWTVEQHGDLLPSLAERLDKRHSILRVCRSCAKSCVLFGNKQPKFRNVYVFSPLRHRTDDSAESQLTWQPTRQRCLDRQLSTTKS